MRLYNNNRIVKLSMIMFLIVITIMGTLNVSAVSGFDRIVFNPDGQNAGDIKALILVDVDGHNYYYRTFINEYDTYEIKNTDFNFEMSTVDYVIAVTSDSDRDGNADDWYMNWIKLKSGTTDKFTFNPDIEFGEWSENGNPDWALMVWHIPSSVISLDLNQQLARDLRNQVNTYYLTCGTFYNQPVKQYYDYGYSSYIYGYSSSPCGYSVHFKGIVETLYDLI